MSPTTLELPSPTNSFLDGVLEQEPYAKAIGVLKQHARAQGVLEPDLITNSVQAVEAVAANCVQFPYHGHMIQLCQGEGPSSWAITNPSPRFLSRSHVGKGELLTSKGATQNNIVKADP